jgi:hypothetical protein
MITFSDVLWYSHVKPVTPAGRFVPPPPATETGLGTEVPSAEFTVAPLGHDAAAVVVVGVESGAAVDVGVNVADDDPVVEDPQALSAVAAASAIRGIQGKLVRVTGDISSTEPVPLKTPTRAL